jgi:tRNA threonylcarbamoyladenosine modification (KEOPS) complex Cgi121 subunit/molybdopterin converting factor small subunit
MITVNFTGGSKKWFNREQIVIEKNDLNIQQLLDHLIETKPKNTVDFNSKNLLIAVNGIESSALSGFETKLKSNDSVNIIPVIHGGSNERTKFKISNQNIEIFKCKKTKIIDTNFLNSLRIEFPDLVIQGVSSNFILSNEHVKKILSISILAKKRNILLSKKIETDILLRFAGTTQISDAIDNLGLTTTQNFLLISIGENKSLNKLRKKILSNLTNSYSYANPKKIENYFKISKKNLDTINSKTPLEDLLAEKASILV